MKILRYDFETTLRFSEPVTDHDFVLRCMPKSSATQIVLDSHLLILPSTTVANQQDGFGNLIQVGRITGEHNEFTFVSSGMVIVDMETERTDSMHPMYLRNSAYASVDADIKAFADNVLRVCPNASPAEKTKKLSQALYKYMTYEKGVTDITTTASQAFAQGKGVCQDYAHILIALCRSQGIAARYANGLMIGDGETHAWVEVYDEGKRWVGVDPTHDRKCNDDYIAIACGRDFSDCAIENGMFRGLAQQEQTVTARVYDQAAD